MDLIKGLLLLLFFVVLFLCLQNIKCTFKRGGGYEDRLRKAMEASMQSSEEDDLRRAREASMQHTKDEELARRLQRNEYSEGRPAAARPPRAMNSDEELARRLQRNEYSEGRPAAARPPRAMNSDEEQRWLHVADAAERRRREHHNRGRPEKAAAAAVYTTEQLSPRTARVMIDSEHAQAAAARRVATVEQRNDYKVVDFKKNQNNSCGPSSLSFIYYMFRRCTSGPMPNLDSITKDMNARMSLFTRGPKRDILYVEKAFSDLKRIADRSTMLSEIPPKYSYYDPIDDKLLVLDEDSVKDEISFLSRVVAVLNDRHRFSAIILNTQKGGGHWVAFIRCNNTYYTFDDTSHIAMSGNIFDFMGLIKEDVVRMRTSMGQHSPPIDKIQFFDGGKLLHSMYKLQF